MISRMLLSKLSETEQQKLDEIAPPDHGEQGHQSSRGCFGCIWDEIEQKIHSLCLRETHYPQFF